jgi:hypothetical protein
VCRKVLLWLAAVRIEKRAKASAFESNQWVKMIVGILILATAPPLMELASRTKLGWPRLNDGAFAMFVLAWVVAAIPGIAASRRWLRAAGINPDHEP